MDKTGLYDLNGKEYIRGQVVSLGKYFDDNEEYGYVEKEFGHWQIIGICKEWNNKTPFQVAIAPQNRVVNFEIVDNIELLLSFEEMRNELHIID